MELSGRSALVTGGAHRIGRAIVLALASRGVSVLLHYHSSNDAARETAREARALGGECWPLAADLAVPAEIERLFARATELTDRLDILVNSAALFQEATLREVSLQAWEQTMAVNLRAPMLCLQRAVPWMERSSRPGNAPALAVNLLDLSSRRAWLGRVHHGVSKAGLAHLTRLAARELAPSVRVNAVMPGAVMPPATLEAESELWQRTLAKVPLAGLGDPAQVGAAVVFLAENDFVTGSILSVDGGESLVSGGAGPVG